MNPVAVVELLVVLGEEIGAVVAAVRCADHGVHVKAGRFVVVEHDTRVVIELDEHDGTVHPVVERRVVAGSPVPRAVSYTHLTLPTN